MIRFIKIDLEEDFPLKSTTTMTIITEVQKIRCLTITNEACTVFKNSDTMNAHLKDSSYNHYIKQTSSKSCLHFDLSVSNTLLSFLIASSLFSSDCIFEYRTILIQHLIDVFDDCIWLCVYPKGCSHFTYITFSRVKHEMG